MATILLTGVTGLVGSCLAPQLQRAGHKILYLIRSKNQQDALARLHSAISIVTENDIPIVGDVQLPHGGISLEDMELWRGKIDKVIHSAGSVKFDERTSRETWKTNLLGTDHMLEVTRSLRVPEFHFLSTAYIVGNADRLAENEFNPEQIPRNSYEASKYEAEGLVRSHRKDYPEVPFSFSVYRPSIIIGDSRNGHIKTLNGYYGFFMTFWRMRQSLWKRWQKEKEKCLAENIGFTKDGFLVLPLVMKCSPVSTLNLISSDWVVDTLASLIELPAANQTFHLTHPNPPKVQWVIETSLQHLKITGLRYTTKSHHPPQSLLERFQRGMDKELERYRPYITQEAKFTHNNLQILDGQYKMPPEINEELLRKMLVYAQSINFGCGPTS